MQKSMKISRKSTSANGEEKLMFSQQDSPVSHLARPGEEEERMMIAISGRKCCELLRKYDRTTSWARMLLESSRWYSPITKLRWRVKPIYSARVTYKLEQKSDTLSTKSVRILKVVDIKSNRYLFQLAVSGLHTAETGCGFLPTPIAQDANLGRVVSGRRRSKTGFSASLSDLAKSFLLPMPQMNMKNFLPTPTARDWKRGRTRDSMILAGRGQMNNLPDYLTIGKGFHLNPRFVAEIMGYSPDYLELPFRHGLNAQSER